jgi:hypothetical protein
LQAPGHNRPGIVRAFRAFSSTSVFAHYPLPEPRSISHLRVIVSLFEL